MTKDISVLIKLSECVIGWAIRCKTVKEHFQIGFSVHIKISYASYLLFTLIDILFRG